MKMPFQTPVILESNLIQADVVIRLQAAVISRYALFKSRSVYPVAGVVKETRCSLETRTFYHNGFQRVLKLRFEDRGSSTLLIGEFSLRFPVLLFGVIWFGFLSMFSVIWLSEFLRGNLHTFTSTPNGSHEAPAVWYEAFFPFLMMGFGWLLLQFGLWLSRRTEDETLRFVKRIASAEVVDPALLRS